MLSSAAVRSQALRNIGKNAKSRGEESHPFENADTSRVQPNALAQRKNDLLVLSLQWGGFEERGRDHQSDGGLCHRRSWRDEVAWGDLIAIGSNDASDYRGHPACASRLRSPSVIA